MVNSLDARAKRVIEELIESSDRGEAAVERACGGDRELAARVRELLIAIDSQDEFLSDPTVVVREGIEQPGSRIGPYKLLQVIGEGGMGTVYMAEQVAPVQRKVALKIIKPGMDSAQVIARFEAERQALAMMEHANIARVLDAGTTGSSRPYFVMELVDGVPITQFCDERRLSQRERLELFVPVCHAIQHAHQKGIIHRDIKPSNVLVTMYDDKPVPKVIDFGVAKAVERRLTEKTMFTQFGALFGTVQYISPEQAEMNAIGVDTRSDIYSLGVLLYELLTGTTPLEEARLRAAAFSEVLRLIKEEEAPRPSLRLSTANNLPKLAAERGTEPLRLSTLLRGDVDWIVMKCLEKDRARRYESANGLARDIQRHLTDEPVEACPPSPAYRVRKFVRRNRWSVTTAGSLFVMLLVAVATVGWAVRDRAAREHEASRDRSARQAVIRERVSLLLEEALTQRGEGRWREALAAAKRAEELTATGGSDEGTRRLAREALADMQMLASLDDARTDATKNEAGLNLKAEDSDYARLFREYGIDIDTLDREAAADLIRNRSIHYELAVFLDCWSQVRRRLELRGDAMYAKDWKELLDIARAADPDPWRDQLRSALRSGDRTALVKLSESAPIAALPAETVDRIGDALLGLGATAEAAAFLKNGQVLHAQDYWINLNLGTGLLRLGRPDEAIRYASAAVSLRPEAARPRRVVASALAAQATDFARRGRREEAVRFIDDLHAEANRSGGVNLTTFFETVTLCVREFQKAGDVDACRAVTERLEHRAPTDIIGCYNAATSRALTAAAQAQNESPESVRLVKQETDRAMTWLEKAIAAGFLDVALLRQDPDLDSLRKQEAFNRLLSDVEAKAPPVVQGHCYLDLSEWNKAAAAFEKADLLAHPLDGDDAFAYACLLLIRGDDESYNRFARGMIPHMAQATWPNDAYVAARTCVVARKSPVDPAQVLQWTSMAMGRTHNPWDFHLQGLAQYRAGQLDQALQSLIEANGKNWKYQELNWFSLALVHHGLGHAEEARKCLDKGIQWLEQDGPRIAERPAKIEPQDWLEAYLLRREVEELLRTKQGE
jgi:serine/threonine protein kinase/tetratricopeptide (TPR) repeat protein